MAGDAGHRRGLAQLGRIEQGWLSHHDPCAAGGRQGAGIQEAWQWSTDRCPGWWVRALTLAADRRVVSKAGRWSVHGRRTAGSSDHAMQIGLRDWPVTRAMGGKAGIQILEE